MTQVLFYENVTPVSQERHKDLCIEPIDFEFAAGVNSVPLTAAEIIRASSEYTIVFAGNEDDVVPVVVLGVEGTTNQYLDETNAWKADYLPAFVRRYPFAFSRSQDEKQFTLCVDETWKGCNREGKGQRLFTDEGEQTPYLENLLKFLGEYQRQFVQTQTYCKRLREFDLLEPMQAKISLPGGDTRSLGGFFSVTRDKIKGLDGEKLAELAKSNELELSYLQMASLNNLSAVAKRSLPKQAADVAEEEPEAETEES